eukprot:GHVU01095750.1.p1 GENE.GHVU01095750.1~~GHVU01095750.1.p1  ORF type:complete len:477 (+),score=25.49 GHVU01095750.1:140-1432(+)
MPFNYWNGTMKYRFQIMSSAFHKGRLKISYDPNFVANEEMNIAYTRIVDLQEETDFTLSIGCGQEKTFMEMSDPRSTATTQIFSTTRFLSREPGNGVLSVSVLNNLTSPSETSGLDVKVNIFVSCGDDIEFAVPSDRFQNFVVVPQSLLGPLIEPHMGDDPNTFVNEQDQMEQPNEDTLLQTYDNMKDTYKVFFGERLASFRSLIKRYNLHTAIGPGVDNNETLSVYTMSMFPFYRGNVPFAVHDSTTGNYNYGNTVLLHWVNLMFSGYRGSIRYKWIPSGEKSSTNLYAERLDPVKFAAKYSYGQSSLATFDNSSQVARHAVQTASFGTPPSGVTGTCFTNSEVNPVLEYEVPYYNASRFSPAKMVDVTSGKIESYEIETTHKLVVEYVGSTKKTFVGCYVAAGEDYNCYFFTGLPQMYYEATVPLALV